MDQLDLDHLSLEVAIILQPQESFSIMTHTLVMHHTMMATIAFHHQYQYQYQYQYQPQLIPTTTS